MRQKWPAVELRDDALEPIGDRVRRRRAQVSLCRAAQKVDHFNLNAAITHGFAFRKRARSPVALAFLGWLHVAELKLFLEHR